MLKCHEVAVDGDSGVSGVYPLDGVGDVGGGTMGSRPKEKEEKA